MTTLYNPSTPPIYGATWQFDINLTSQADTDVFKTTVTLAAGDIQVSKDGAQYANLATFPPAERDLAGGADSGTLLVLLTALEMTASKVAVLFHDATGSEWQDALVEIYPVVAVTPDVNTTTVAGAAAALAIRDTLKLAPSTGDPVAGSVDAHLDTLVTSTTTIQAVTDTLATDAEIADAVLDELTAGHVTTGSAGKALSDAATGANRITADYGSTEKAAIDLLDDAVGGLADIHTDVADIHTDVVNIDADLATVDANVDILIGGAGSAHVHFIIDDGTNVLDGVEIAVYSEAAKSTLVAAATTDSLGAATIYLDPGTYYVQCTLAPYTFSDTTVVWV